MAQLTCSACHRGVAEEDVTCPGCGSLLGVPGAVTRVAEPSEPTVPLGTEPPATPCSTPGCGQPAMRGRTLCRRCFVRQNAAREYVLLAPWGERLTVADGQTVPIGRKADFSPYASHLQEAQFISGTHAFFACAAGRLTVRDLDSTNGTRVNSIRVDAQQEVQLVTGDVITLGGQVQFIVG
jgi:hypothetical protein